MRRLVDAVAYRLLVIRASSPVVIARRSTLLERDHAMFTLGYDAHKDGFVRR